MQFRTTAIVLAVAISLVVSSLPPAAGQSAGAVNFTEPHATVEMGYPTVAARYTWQSAPLADGQTYRFTIRIATAPWPSGLETQNTDSHVGTIDCAFPEPPVLSAAVL